MREGDLVPEEIAGGRETLADQQTGGGQAVEELVRRGSTGHCPAHGLTKFLPRRALPAFPLGLVPFGAGRTTGCGAIAGGEAAQPVVDLDHAGFRLGTLTVLADTGLAAVLSYD